MNKISAFVDSARYLRVAEGLESAARGEVFLNVEDLKAVLQVFTDAVSWHTSRALNSCTGQVDAYLLLIRCQNHGRLSPSEEKAREAMERIVRIEETLRIFSGQQNPGAERLKEAAGFCRLLGHHVFQLCTPPMQCTDFDDN